MAMPISFSHQNSSIFFLSGTININGLIEEKKTNVVHFLVG
jgi:hypothetical protein